MVNFASGDKSLNLNLIQVPGEPIENNIAGIRTRSATKNSTPQWTSIPCSVKIVKLLLNEIRSLEESRDAQSDGDSDSDDEFDDSSSDTHNSSSPRLADKLQSYIDEAADEYDDEVDEEDVIDEAVNKLNLEEYLTGFLRGFKTSPLFGEFYAQLSDVEKQTVDRI